MGADAFGELEVREDDGTVPDQSGNTATPLPSAGQQGDACAELAALDQPGELDVSVSAAKADGVFTVTGSGFRAGEGVAVSFADEVVADEVADADGAVEVEITVPSDISLGRKTISTIGSGSGFSATGTVWIVDTEFTDVPIDHQFYDEITWLSARGITTGYHDGTFRPLAPVERQATAAFLYRLAGSPEVELPASSPFTDVPIDHQFYKEIVWLSESGITTGYRDGTFRPRGAVERKAMAAFLYRAAGEPAVDPPSGPVFTDVPADHQFAGEIAWLSEAGVTEGLADGSFRPDGQVQRQAMAAFLYRFDAL
ncbi:S-layer homology domain-containing protein [Aeromicrobium piscarium]|uniref:S-layer homology domain-containing protein n=2 Tax=Aeromicrobium piscarium TaxID=2590901 RepID=A0A554S7W6_9ACTN|nr:S-layer homology domain-containing protein [Aeromicrobium piscarium]